MTAAKHTPGPWAVDPRKIGALWNVLTADGENDVALAAQIVGDDQKQSIRSANACLISMAPDLLEALKLLVNVGRYPTSPKHEKAWAIAQTVLDKAEGRQV